MAKYVKMFNLHGQKQPNPHCTLFSLWLPFCTPPQTTWPETITCTNPHCHSPFSLVDTFLHPRPSQHGQKQQPAPTHTATQLSLLLIPFCTHPQPTYPETTTCTNSHCHSPFSLVGVPFCGLAGWWLGCRTLLRGANT